MSGRTKKILYYIADWLLFCAAVVGAVLLVLYAVPQPFGTAEWVVIGVLIAAVLLRLPALIHELGHLIFGLFAGMKPVSFTVAYFRFSGKGVSFAGDAGVAGATEAFPKSGKNVRARTMAFTIGGGVFNFIVGIALAVPFPCCAYHPALLFCCIFALFLFAEGVRALIPAQLSAGKTDGAVLLGLVKRLPEEEVMLKVLTAQGMLYRGAFSDIPRALLFETPVVREDLPAYHALLMLRAQFLLAAGEEGEAQKVLERILSLSEYLSGEEMENVKKILQKAE